jgi:hypothetical protein
LHLLLLWLHSHSAWAAIHELLLLLPLLLIMHQLVLLLLKKSGSCSNTSWQQGITQWVQLDATSSTPS